jgi:hypothetical protein
MRQLALGRVARENLQLDRVGAEPQGQLDAVVGDRSLRVERHDQAPATERAGGRAGHARRGQDRVGAAGHDPGDRLGRILEAAGAAEPGMVHRDHDRLAVGGEQVVHAALGPGLNGRLDRESHHAPSPISRNQGRSIASSRQ